MSWVELLGYFAIFLMGSTLGIIGAGGSILTVPILVYLFGMEPTLATAYSLVLVGGTAAAGGLRHAIRRDFDFEAFITFGVPSVVSVYLARRYVLPAIPEGIGSVGSFEVTRDGFIMMIFAIFMLAAAFLMIWKRPVACQEEPVPRRVSFFSRLVVGCEGFVVGGITGLVGAGGGFLIVPALIYFMGLPIRRAVATSLIVIAVKSLVGFVGDLQGDRVIDWPFLLWLLTLSSVGILFGVRAGRKLPASLLQRGFGWFVLVVGVVMISREILG